jgi:hypothetical protein
MNAGVSLTLDEDMRYCITLADLEDTGAGYLLHWDDQITDYVLEQFILDANASITMSQWRTERGPAISHLDEFYTGSEWCTSCGAFIDGSNWDVYEFIDELKVPVRHSLDPFEAGMSIFAYFPDADAYDNLWLVAGPSP